MNSRLLFALAFILVSQMANASPTCSYDTSTTPGLPIATCAFPSCPSGFDCMPPVVDKTTANVTYGQPLIAWRGTCPDNNFQSSCWEVHMDFTALIAATDASGVDYVGVNLAQEVSNRRTFKKYWSRVTPDKKDAQGRYTMTGTAVAYVPPGQQLLLSVYELCSRDSINNEGCIFPLGKTH